MYEYVSHHEQHNTKAFYKMKAQCIRRRKRKKRPGVNHLCKLLMLKQRVVSDDKNQTFPTREKVDECDGYRIAVYSSGIIDTETHGVHHGEADCIDMYRSAVELLSSHRPPAHAKKGTTYKRNEGDVLGEATVTYTVLGEGKVERAIEKYKKMQEQCNSHGMSLCKASSTGTTIWDTSDRKQPLPISAWRSGSVKIGAFRLAGRTQEFKYFSKIELMDKRNRHCLPNEEAEFWQLMETLTGQGKSLSLQRHDKPAEAKEVEELQLKELLGHLFCDEKSRHSCIHKLADVLKSNTNAKTMQKYVKGKASKKMTQSKVADLCQAAAFCDTRFCRQLIVELEKVRPQKA